MSLAAQVFHARRDPALAARRPARPIGWSPERVLELQRTAGNAAVSELIALQRCGPTPCGCPEEVQRAALAGMQPLAGNAAVSDLFLQREAAAVPAAAGGGVGAAPAGGVAAGCPPEFCTPYANKAVAYAVRQATENTLLAGIAVKVNPRVVPLWAIYLHGGTSPLDLSATFGADFTASLTTAGVTDFLVDELKADLTGKPPVFSPGSSEVLIDLPTRLGAAMTTDIGDPGGRKPMDFDVIGEIPGNIAGGIGKDQLSCPVGAMPSPFNDDRAAFGTARVVKNPDGTLTVTPSITFKVQDTIDLCPGNCGADLEQYATIPLSRMEASGIAGDVPFTVRFPAPPRTFTITPASPPVVPKPSVAAEGQTTASMLRIRKEPRTSAPVVGAYPRGTKIEIVCQTSGTLVDGNVTWDQTDRGFVADRYVKRLDATEPPDCP